MASLRTLVPDLVPYAEWLLELGQSVAPDLVVTSARRSFSEQSRLYEKYRRGESTLPALPPGKSMHEAGLAFDLARPGIDPHQDELLAALGDVWNQVGGKWHASDPVHFEV